MELKSIAKSVRLKPSAYAAVEAYRGDGFNEKLCNLIDGYIQERPQLESQRGILMQEIESQRQELRQLKERVQQMRMLNSRLDALDSMLSALVAD